MRAVFKKIPVPMIVPMTRAMVSRRESPRINSVRGMAAPCRKHPVSANRKAKNCGKQPGAVATSPTANFYLAGLGEVGGAGWVGLTLIGMRNSLAIFMALAVVVWAQTGRSGA